MSINLGHIGEGAVSVNKAQEFNNPNTSKYATYNQIKTKRVAYSIGSISFVSQPLTSSLTLFVAYPFTRASQTTSRM